MFYITIFILLSSFLPRVGRNVWIAIQRWICRHNYNLLWRIHGLEEREPITYAGPTGGITSARSSIPRMVFSSLEPSTRVGILPNISYWRTRSASILYRWSSMQPNITFGVAKLFLFCHFGWRKTMQKR